jgi:peptidyl-prolyl cis-trans isomerase SurA
MHRAILGVLSLCGMLLSGAPAEAVLLDKILAVANGEVLTLQDFEDHLALRTIFQPGAVEVDRDRAFQRFVDQTLIRQEALRTRIVEVDDAEVTQQLHALEQQPARREEFAKVMQERSLSLNQVRIWLRQQFIVQAFIDRRIRLFVRISDGQIMHYYEQHQQALGEPLSDAVRQQIRRILIEQQVTARLTAVVEELRRKGNLDFPP